MTIFTSDEYDELSNYVSYENSSIGDHLSGLINLSSFETDTVEAINLQRAINAELLYWLERFRNETKFVETTEIVERTSKELEWI